MRANITVEHMIEFFEQQVRKLVEGGVPADRVAEALSATSVRAGVHYGLEGHSKLTAAAERLRVASERAVSKPLRTDGLRSSNALCLNPRMAKERSRTSR